MCLNDPYYRWRRHGALWPGHHFHISVFELAFLWYATIWLDPMRRVNAMNHVLVNLGVGTVIRKQKIVDQVFRSEHYPKDDHRGILRV